MKAFWKSSTSHNISIDDYSKRICNATAINGRVWIVVDSNKKDAQVLTKADERKFKAKVYSYIVLPQYALDMGYDEMGILNWILFQENVRDDDSPILSTGLVIPRYRLWTRTFSQLFTIKGNLQKDGIVTAEAPIAHELGIVPVFAADNIISDEPYSSPALIADVAYLDRAIANYLSNLDAIIQDQTFSQLAIPAQGLTSGVPEDDAKIEKLVEFGTKQIFTFNGEAGTQPFYLSPDVKQAQIILQVVNKIIWACLTSGDR